MGAETKPKKAAGRVLAIDYGRRRLGLAVSDESRMVARPIETVERVNRRADLARLRKIAREQEITQLVVGLPLRLGGTEGEMAAEARAFAARVAKALRLPVAMVDERLTSWEASEGVPHTQRRRVGHPEDSMRKDGVWATQARAYSKAQRAPDGVDSLAAALILEEYLRKEADTR